MSTSLLLAACLFAAEKDAPEPERLVAHIDRETSAALRDEAKAKKLLDRGKAIVTLCALHREIVADPRFETLEQMKQIRARLWSRLVKARTELKRQLAKEGEPQLSDEDSQAAGSAADSLAGSLFLSDFSTGSPTSYIAGGGASQEDYNAQQLIELIQRTINPDTWDVVGGPGTIFYYAPLKCLVIRATAEVHDNVGGVLGALR